MTSRNAASLLANLCLVASIFSNVLFAADASRSPIRIISPDSRFTVELSLGDGGRPVYSVNRFRDAVIQPSGLGFTLARRRRLDPRL